MRALLFSVLLYCSSISATARDYVITDYGAKSDTTELCTAALQQCIDLCSEAGGGRVVVPAGHYKTGTIILRSNVNLHLELGATLYGSTNLQNYRRMTTSYKSLRTHTPTIQLIYADAVENVVIDGYGTIDGQGRVFPKQSWNDEGITRPHLLRFIQSRDIVVRDVTLRNSGCWMQHYLACDRIRIDGIRVVNRNNYNNDALDLDGCHDVIVRGVTADSDDDGITLKSTSPRLCENIVIADCVVSSHCNAVKLGTETNGGFRNISIRNIVVKPSDDQSSQFFGRPRGTSALSLEIVDGGMMENVSVDGMTVTGTESPIFVRLGHRGRGWTFSKNSADAFVAQSVGGGNEGATRSQKPDSVETIGRIRGIYINNVRARDCGNYGCSITGLPGHPVENVHVSNVSIHHNGGVTRSQLPDIDKALRDEKAAEYPEATMWGLFPAKGFFVRHARGVHFDNVEVNTEQTDARPEFVKEDVSSWGDQGDGTYRNPVLCADFSDPDVIRVQDKYYMVASDFHFMGMQVLESEDMVNWRYASQIYNRFDMPGWDAMAHYAGGSWAPAIRYHNGMFYVFFCTPDEGLFMSTAQDAHGPWSPLHCVKNVEKWEDPCPFWDDETGEAYLGRSRHRAGPIIVHRMSADGRTLLDDGVTVYTGPVAEGTKFLKRNGYYYLVIPEGGVGTGWQTVLRARSIYGPYERRIVLEQGSTSINGPHQGALVDTPDGQWWFYHFQETPVLGRIVHLQPVRWENDWPVIGTDLDGNGIGEPVDVWAKPAVAQVSNSNTPFTLQQSDEFEGVLGLQWQWNHNPVDSHWSLTERKGWLTLHALPADSLKACRNQLTQKVIGYHSTATTLVEQKGNCNAGLFLSGKLFRGVGICKNGVFIEVGGKQQIIKKGRFPKLYLRVMIDAERNQHQFYYSTDGKQFHAAGESFAMKGGYWKGIRTGLFCYGKNGLAQFDYYHIE